MTASSLTFKTLPLSERIQLVEDIWDSIAEETSGAVQLSDQERSELHARYAGHEADPKTSLPWSEVRTALFKGQH